MNTPAWLAWLILLALFVVTLAAILTGGAWLDRAEARANRRTQTNLQRSKERSLR